MSEPPQGDEKPTVEDLIHNLTNTVLDGFAAMGDRMALVEKRQDGFESWRRNNSDRVRGLAKQSSESDLSQDAKLSAEIIARRDLEKKVDAIDVKQNEQIAILGRIEALAKNPIVKQVLTAVGTAIIVWLAQKGIHVQ